MFVVCQLLRCGFFSTHQSVLQFSAGSDWVSYKFNSGLTLSTWRQCQIPQVKGSVPQDCPLTPLDATHKSTGFKWEASTTPSLGPINLLEWLTELRETFTFVYQFIIKDIIRIQKNSWMKRYSTVRSGSILGVGTYVPVEFQVYHPPSMCVGSGSRNMEALQTPSFQVLVDASLPKQD